MLNEEQIAQQSNVSIHIHNEKRCGVIVKKENITEP